MSVRSPSGRRGVAWRLLPLAVIVLFAFAFIAFWVAGDKKISLESLVSRRAIIDGVVSQYCVMSILAFAAIYIGTVAISLPGGARESRSAGIDTRCRETLPCARARHHMIGSKVAEL